MRGAGSAFSQLSAAPRAGDPRTAIGASLHHGIKPDDVGGVAHARFVIEPRHWLCEADRGLSDCRPAVLDHAEVPVKLSARNKLDGAVTSIHKGEAIANVTLDVGGQRLMASITVEAVDELGLKEGTAVSAIIKASDVIVATRD
jgi:molybdopterin-binding protein